MKFEEWADKQFGKEPHRELSKLWEKVNLLRYELRRIEQKIKDKERWIDNRKAALYAWNIKDKEKT